MRVHRTMSKALLAAVAIVPAVMVGVARRRRRRPPRRRSPLRTSPTSPARARPRTPTHRLGSRLGLICRTPRAASTGTSWCPSSSTTRPARRRSRPPCRRPTPRPSGSSRRAPCSSSPPSTPSRPGFPVTGSYDDGPEWGTQPYTNMFASDDGSVDPKYPVNTQIGDFLKAARRHGAGCLRVRRSRRRPAAPPSPPAQSFQHAGGKVGVLNTTVPFGGVDFTSDALVAKQDGVNAMVPAMDANSNYALADRAQAGGSEAQGHVSSRPVTSRT